MPRRRKTPKEESSSSSAAPEDQATQALDRLEISRAAPSPRPVPPRPASQPERSGIPIPASVVQESHGPRPVPAPAREIQRPVAGPAPAAVPVSVAPQGPRPVQAPPQEIQRPVVAPTPVPCQPVPVSVASSMKALSFPRRPGYGTIGSKGSVRTNHFLMRLPDRDVYHYDVTIYPEVKSRGVNRIVMQSLIAANLTTRLGRRAFAYDGRKSLYASGQLPFESGDFEVLVADDNSERQRSFRVKITHANTISINHLKMFLAGRQADVPYEALQAVDVVLREVPILIYTPVGRSFFSPTLGRQLLGSGLEGWKGFFQSARPTQMGMSLNLDLSATAFIQELPVIDYVSQSLRKNLDRPLSEADKAKVRRLLRSLKVEVTHRGSVKRRYRVSGITTETTRELTFPVDEMGTMQSVVNYFKEKYGYTIRYPFLPSLQVGSTERANYLPMEVCKVAKGQRYPKRLDESQVSRLRELACQRPHERERDILQCVTGNGYNANNVVQGFGITVDTNATVVEARQLPVPMLKFHETCPERIFRPPLGRWNMANKKMVNGAAVKTWACINFARLDAHTLGMFCDKLVHTCQNAGMAFNPRPFAPAISARPEHVESVIIQLCNQVMQQTKEHLQLLVAILPDVNGLLYGNLKRVCETRIGIISQCCLQKNVCKMNIQYLANVALKINAKVGGRNTVLDDAFCRRIPLITDKPTIIFGADVTHPHAGEDSLPSIAAVVASQDWPEITKYAGVVRAQTHRKEIIEHLYQSRTTGGVIEHGGMIRELLLCFYQTTRQKPARLMFYRDGVSEGQFQQVLQHELNAIYKACASLEPNYKPTVTFVVVQKRHHTRLFPMDSRKADRSGNVLPGTVVDTKICHPTEFDFYLCSHAGIQGTSRPAHYHVLWDENRFTADGLQKFTNDLCYTYARSTTAVSYVPPAYYAHLAAFRARYYMASDSSDSESGSHPVARELPAVQDRLKKFMFYC